VKNVLQMILLNKVQDFEMGSVREGMSVQSKCSDHILEMEKEVRMRWMGV